MVKNLNEGDLRDMDSILRSGRSPRGGHDRVQQTHKYYGKICEILKVEPCVPYYYRAFQEAINNHLKD